MTSLNQLWLGLDGRYERGGGVSVSGCVCRGGGLVGWGCVRGVMVASCFSFAVVDGVAASLGSCGSFAGVRLLLALASCTPLVARVHHGAWGRVVTPLRPAAWERGLQAHPNREFAAYVCAGIREGFRVGFCYATARCVPARGNMSSVGEHSDVVIKYIQDERVLGRVLGPFRREDFPEVQVIPKSEPGKWRLILDLSSPIGLSVNAGISKEWSSIACITVDVVTAQVVRAGRGALMAKFDLKSAYRNVPVHPDDRWLLGMSLDGALYVDVALPFGLRSAPKFFYAVADALTFLIQQKGAGWSIILMISCLLALPGRPSVAGTCKWRWTCVQMWVCLLRPRRLSVPLRCSPYWALRLIRRRWRCVFRRASWTSCGAWCGGGNIGSAAPGVSCSPWRAA